MFKLESYITPILLSYVDRYIKNFKLEDSQVSLWGGDASFHNLDLRLDVLEQELHLPFSFVSGHIRELLIHVPWTKLNSQPITITINTIECILKLRGTDSTASPEAARAAREKQKRPSTKQEVEAPPGYVQLLINKIVSNISIYCNNLILKYVEEDIVMSMNVKHLKFESANEKWEPAFSDLSPVQVMLRKIVAVNDLTLCLDKRNAAGKIDIYQEPMLYRCSMTMHLLRHYHSATASRASTTRLDIYCNKMQFSMTEQQVPMLMRLIMLLYALQQKQLKPDNVTPIVSQSSLAEIRDMTEQTETWTGWAWSYVSSVLPMQWEEDWNNQQPSPSGHTLQIGFYVDNLSITFKVSETSPSDRGYYSQKKLKYWPMLQLQLQGIYSETITHGMKWLNASFGIGEALLLPQGCCSCAQEEVKDGSVPVPYLKLGAVTNFHKTDSLFDAEAVENKGERRNYNLSWDYHMMTFTESVLLERTSAFALDYVYQMELPEDMTSERLSEIGSDYEFSNLSEMSNLRVCFGPFKLKLCSGFFHRIQSLKVAASYYDYAPYSTPKPDLGLNELLPPSEDDFDALNAYISGRSTRITFFAPIIEMQLMDHPFFLPTKGTIFRKRKKNSAASAPKILPELPKVTVECQFLDVTITTPMYVNRLVHTTCQLPDPPPQMFDACYYKVSVKVLGLCSKLLINPQRHTTIITPCSASYFSKSILKPQYWINSNIPHRERTFESEGVTLNATKAKMMVVCEIIDKMIKLDPCGTVNSIHNTTLLIDASKDFGLPYIELCVEGIRFRQVTTNTTVSTDMSAGSIKAFILEPLEIKVKGREGFVSRDIQQVLFISGPEPRKDQPVKSLAEEMPLFSATVQYPLDPDVQAHPPILVFNLQEIRICVDPMLCRWMLYSPKQVPQNKLDFLDSIHKRKNISEASGSIIETPRKFSQLESVHSSSEKELTVSVPSKKIKIQKEGEVDVQEHIYNVLKKWFDVWKGMLLSGDISQCTIYFPMESLSAVGAQGIQEAIEQAINRNNPPEIMIITLPFASIRSQKRHNIQNYLKSLPVILPENIWTSDRSSFPWTMSISDLSCYSIQFGKKLTFLQPVSLNATVGLSAKPCKEKAQPENEITGPSNKKDLGYLGICVHIDMTPVVISTCEVQVYLFASILYGLMEVVTNLTPDKPNCQKAPELLPPLPPKSGGSTLTPTLIRESTESMSETTPPITSQTEIMDKDNVRLTAWVQWTITRFTVELLSDEYKVKCGEDPENIHPHLKLVIDAEDIVSSLDFQSIYLKIKSKIGSLSIQHYKRSTPNSHWRPGPFSGIVMRLQEDVSTGQRHEDNGFISITITRASCKHTHTLWGAVQKKQKDKKSELFNMMSTTRYITEIVVNIQPIDFVLSLKTLRSFYLVLAPLLQIPKPKNKTETEGTVLSYLNNQVLPLAYVECQDIRVIMPSCELGSAKTGHDVYVLQVHRISLNPTAVNPIIRVPVRPDIYEQAAHARILNIPGSDVEDRQYQLDIIGMSISTGPWEDIDPVLSSSNSVNSTLRALSENPALEWNNLEQGQPNMTPMLNLWPVTDKFDISVVAAPAMIYHDHTVICGNSMEVNFVTDIFVYLSLEQIKLSSALVGEFFYLLEPFILKDEISKRPKIKLPYTSEKISETIYYEYDDDDADAQRDSGIDTSDIRSLTSFKAIAPTGGSVVVPTISESERLYVFPRPPNPLPPAHNVVPVEVLITAGKIILSLYQMDRSERGRSLYLKRKKSSKEDQSYQSSEETTDTENSKLYTPLIYVALNQPNCFISKQHMGRKFQISCFDLNVKFTDPEFSPVDHVPIEPDFPLSLVETKSGSPDPNTGILPAFLTLRLTRGLTRNATLDVDISRPIKILCSSSKWSHLAKIKDRVTQAFKTDTRTSFVSVTSENKSYHSQDVTFGGVKSIKYGETYAKFQEMKDALCGIQAINVHCSQLLFAMISRTGHEVNLSCNSMRSELVLCSRPEKITNSFTLKCLTLTVVKENFRKILLNPWTLTFELCLFWESWQTAESEPKIQLTAESDCIIFDVSPAHVQCVQMVLKDLQEFISKLPKKEREWKQPEPVSDKDQHYKDDLRAGAFQFVDANSNTTDELPLPYQVMFWTKDISAMAWRYPQPRALTKVRVFPVPYKITMDTEDDLEVLCKLEYWSDVRNCYLPYTEFYLSENDVCHLNLPKSHPQIIVACTWRVVINTFNKSDDDKNFQDVFVSPRALAACMRIDSYFNRNLIPNFSAALYITKIDVNLYSYINKKSEQQLPKCLRNYKPDILIPENQKFLVLTWDNLTSYLTSWNMEMFSFEMSASTKSSVLDYTYLTEQPLLDPFTYKLEVSMSDSLRLNFLSRPIQLRIGPNIAHTLAVSGQLWSQSVTNSEKNDFIIVSRYVVCNDTNVNIRFGQTSTDEDILLMPRHFHLYCWRTQKRKQEMRIALEQNEWIWSRTIKIQHDGIQVVKMSSGQNLRILVTIKSLSSTQKQIIFSAQLTVANMLLEPFEFKVVTAQTDKESKETEFKSATAHVIGPRLPTPSILLNTDKEYFLRMRFYGLESTWTGDIPLREHTTGSQPWLVKVPLQEKGQFLSIWVRVVTQEIDSTNRILAMLWPLFAIRSSLPINAEVHIETPTLKVQLDSIVRGKGEVQQLYCPGTIDHSHNLSFKLENGITTPTPYVPLHYSLVDQQSFFRNMDTEDVDHILEVLADFNETKWPNFGDELDNIDWIIGEQPMTHVKVRYRNACQYSSSLMLELYPWCMIVNTFGGPVSFLLSRNKVNLCRIPHNGIVAPPTMEENFHISVHIKGTWYTSAPLQLAKSDWSQTFYMPKITGTIPLDGNVTEAIYCDKYVAMLSISSTISNEIRLLRVASTHVLCNLTNISLQVLCFVIPDVEEIFELPFSTKVSTVNVRPTQEHDGVSIKRWLNVTGEFDNVDFAFYMTFSIKPELGWSCPVRVDKPTVRRSLCLSDDKFAVPICLTTTEHKGQTFVAINHDPRPQIFIENKSNVHLLCAQISPEYTTVKESQHFEWNCEILPNSSIYYTMPLMSEKFPEIPPTNYAELLCFGSKNKNDGKKVKWSEHINITVDNEQFLRVPYFGDLKVSIINNAMFTHILLESVSLVEISARDIRVRLSLNTSIPDTAEFTENGLQRSISTDTTDDIAVPEEQVFLQNLHTMYDQHKMMLVPPSSTRTSRSIERNRSVQVNTIPMNDRWKSVEIKVFLKSFSTTLSTELRTPRERCELASFTCDNVAVGITQTDVLTVNLVVSDIQFDNQLYSRESYDFPVVFIGQAQNQDRKLGSLNVPIEVLLLDTTDALLVVDAVLESFPDPVRNSKITCAKSVNISLQPISCYIEDVYITRLNNCLKIFSPSKLVLWAPPKGLMTTNRSRFVYVPDIIAWQLALASSPLTVSAITISPVSILLSVHCSIKLYIALDQSPLQFGKFERRRLFTTPYRLGHALTMHYLSGAIFRAGWVVSSLELLGSPGGLARAMGTGLRDFVSLPYRGLVQGPMAFLRGVTQGSASLMWHITSGTLQSVTKLASSVARNLDRLTLDEEHLRRTEEQRRQRPQGLAQGFMQGLTGLGISILGAVGGIAHHPLQSVMSDGASPRALAAGVGLGLVGVITKPLSGAAELLALTGQGLLQGAGWNSLPEARNQPVLFQIYTSPNSVVKYSWKLSSALSNSNILYATDATLINNSDFEATALILTSEALVIINTEEDRTDKVLSLSELSSIPSTDPTLLILSVTPKIQPIKQDDENAIQMDPVSRARVADYVRNTVGLLNLQENVSSEISVSPLVSPAMSTTSAQDLSTTYSFYVNPQNKSYFLCILSLAQQQHPNYHFPVL